MGGDAYLLPEEPGSISAGSVHGHGHSDSQHQHQNEQQQQSDEQELDFAQDDERTDIERCESPDPLGMRVADDNDDVDGDNGASATASKE